MYTGIFREVSLCVMRNLPHFPKEKPVNPALVRTADGFGFICLFWRRGTEAWDPVLSLAWR